MRDTNKTIKELVKAGFTEEQAVLLGMRFVNEEKPQYDSIAAIITEIRELKLWLINRFGELEGEIINTLGELNNKRQRDSFGFKWMEYIPFFLIPVFFAILFVVVFI